MELFINHSGKPIIPKCGNCTHWKKVNPEKKDENDGYCKLIKLQFAFTLKKNVYAITKDFYRCESHELHNHQQLEQAATKKYYDNIELAVKDFQGY